MKILILGHGRHGKDTAAEMLNEISGGKLSFESSSLFAAKKVVYPKLKRMYGYRTVEECYNDRHHHRQEWYNLISEYNTPYKGRLCRELLKEYDIYVGMRSLEEYKATKSLFNLILWVDAFKRHDIDPTMKISYKVRDMELVDNNTSIEWLKIQMEILYNLEIKRCLR